MRYFGRCGRLGPCIFLHASSSASSRRRVFSTTCFQLRARSGSCMPARGAGTPAPARQSQRRSALPQTIRQRVVLQTPGKRSRRRSRFPYISARCSSACVFRRVWSCTSVWCAGTRARRLRRRRIHARRYASRRVSSVTGAVSRGDSVMRSAVSIACGTAFHVRRYRRRCGVSSRACRAEWERERCRRAVCGPILRRKIGLRYVKGMVPEGRRSRAEVIERHSRAPAGHTAVEVGDIGTKCSTARRLRAPRLCAVMELGSHTRAGRYSRRRLSGRRPSERLRQWSIASAGCPSRNRWASRLQGMGRRETGIVAKRRASARRPRVVPGSVEGSTSARTRHGPGSSMTCTGGGRMRAGSGKSRGIAVGRGADCGRGRPLPSARRAGNASPENRYDARSHSLPSAAALRSFAESVKVPSGKSSSSLR